MGKEKFCIDDFASDALPMALASSDTIHKLIGCDFPDIGNAAVMIVSLVFMRARSYAVNARKIQWRERELSIHGVLSCGSPPSTHRAAP